MSKEITSPKKFAIADVFGSGDETEMLTFLSRHRTSFVIAIGLDVHASEDERFCDHAAHIIDASVELMLTGFDAAVELSEEEKRVGR